MNILNRRIQPWHTFGLPCWWYATVLWRSNKARNGAIATREHGLEYLTYCIRLSICLRDIHYIEHLLQAVDITRFPVRLRWQAFLDIGLALYDLGDREQGIVYLEQAATLSLDYQQEVGPNAYIALWALSSRVNEKKYNSKRLQYARHFDKLYPNNVSAKIAMVHVYIGHEMFDNAKSIIDELIPSDRKYSVLLADLYYEKKDFQQASNIYDEYKLPTAEDWWFAHFDYKKASAYYRTGQGTKWKKQAIRIGRRLAWDKFYTLDYLESEGVERIPEIDDYIFSVPRKPLFLDFERMGQYLRRLPRIVWTTFLWYRYHILCALFVLASLLAVLGLLLKLLQAKGPGGLA